jgi:hypothetical protein
MIFFISDIESWIADNLNIDIVLDKISETGMDSLKWIRKKEFLKIWLK